MTLDQSVDAGSDKKNNIEIPCSEVILGEMHNLIWADPKIRSYIQEKYGFSIITCNFYSMPSKIS
jgi:hypothetical protein